MKVRNGAAIVVALLASVGASAQTVTAAELDDVEFGREACDDDAPTVQLDIETSGAAGTRHTLRAVFFADVSATQGAIQCPTNQAGATLFRGREVTAVMEPIAIAPRDLLGDAACTAAGERGGNAALCIFLDNIDDTIVDSVGIPVAFDTATPARPTIENLSSGNARISFDVGNLDEDSGDIYEYLVQHRPCTAIVDDGDGGATDVGDAGPAGEEIAAESICDAPGDFTQTVVRSDDVAVTGLKNDVKYEVRLVVRDDFGNVSEPSEAVTATPQKGISPLDFYNGAGTPYSTAPSCSSLQAGAPSLFGLVALLGLVALRRRRRTLPSGSALSLLLLPVLLAASTASAQDNDGFERVDTRNGEVTLSIFAGPYHPGIDTEQVDGGAVFPIYGCFFDDATLVELGVSLDYHLLDIFGSLQLGVGVNATQAKGFSLPPTATGVDDCSERTDDSVELTIVKVKPQLSYRLDPLLDWFGFPLVPYGRVGLVGAGYAFTTNGLFPDAPSKAQNPVGLVLGWEAAGGLMLALDFWDYLDPFSKFGTKRARAHDVFDHAFVYGEAMWQPVDNFGRPSLILSPTDPFSGTSSPWTVHFGVAVELL